MGYYKYVRELWKNPKKNMPVGHRERLLQLRTEPVTIRLEKPTRPDRARALGYKAKQGYFVVRQRVIRGGRQRPVIKKGRRSKHQRRRKVLDINYQLVAEQRVAKKYPNCAVLNSYHLIKDGNYYWYEVILVDKAHPAILADKNISWIAAKHQRGRVFRGLTSTARKSRGLRHKGKGAEHLRPSRAADRRRKKI